MVMLVMRFGSQKIRQFDGITSRNLLRAGWFDADGRSRHGSDRESGREYNYASVTNPDPSGNERGIRWTID